MQAREDGESFAAKKNKKRAKNQGKFRGVKLEAIDHQSRKFCRKAG